MLSKVFDKMKDDLLHNNSKVIHSDEMTNNTAERAVKPFVVQRKVFQTSGSYAGAAITTKLFSIIQTSAINNINVERYLNYVFENINKEPIENLLPYSKNIIEKLK